MMLRATLAIAALALLAAAPARAALTLCNRTSYRMDVALGLAKQANVATRGWFRLDPGQCRPVIDGALDADLVYVHARTPPIYGSAPAPKRGNAAFCVRRDNFDLADGRNCPLGQQVPFSPARPSESDNGPVVKLAEDAGYDDAQARLAGIQRLLTIAGYDASPIDGVDGSKTQGALKAFLNDRKLPADAAAQPAFFDQLLAAARDPHGRGFSWCNDTPYTVMASLGLVEMGAIVTRGWYRVPAHGACGRTSPAIRTGSTVTPRRSTAMAAPSRATASRCPGAATILLCTQAGKFEISNHKNCAGRGLDTAGFAAVTTRRQAVDDRCISRSRRREPPARTAPRNFGHVETWVFDLDNTLYPHHLNLWQQVDVRIRDYIAAYLKVPQDEAFRVQKDYYKRYGTTMRGLMTEHGMAPDDYLDFVHQIDHSPLTPNAALGAALENLPGRKLILTNGTRKHAEAVMRRLGGAPSFRGRVRHRRRRTGAEAFGADLCPLPRPPRVDPERAAMFEDLARNLVEPHALGMTTVLVVPEGTREVFREDWELEGRDAPHVDHVTDDLTGFLDRR